MKIQIIIISIQNIHKTRPPPAWATRESFTEEPNESILTLHLIPIHHLTPCSCLYASLRSTSTARRAAPGPVRRQWPEWWRRQSAGSGQSPSPACSCNPPSWPPGSRTNRRPSSPPRRRSACRCPFYSTTAECWTWDSHWTRPCPRCRCPCGSGGSIASPAVPWRHSTQTAGREERADNVREGIL